MGNLKNAPVIYTLGMFRFPHTPIDETIIEKLKAELSSQYPSFETSKTQAYNTTFNQQGISVNSQTIKTWQFATKAKEWGFVLSEQSFGLHASNFYYDFKDFSIKFNLGIETLKKVMNIQWITSIGMRYVNLIEPKNGLNVNDYLKPWLLPTQPNDIPVKLINDIYVARYNSKFGELRLQMFHNPSFTLPPELNSQFIINNTWIRPQPRGEFALVDLDHFITKIDDPKFSSSMIIEKLGDLRNVSNNIFKSIGTDLAMKEWKSDGND